jgi:DNA-binding NtrC family response regulator
MANPNSGPVLLDDLPPPLLDAALAWCAAQGLDPVPCRDGSLPGEWTAPFSLCISFVEKVGVDVEKRLATGLADTFPSPWIVVTRDSCSEQRAWLHRLGVEAVLDSRMRPADLLCSMTRLLESSGETPSRHLDGWSRSIETLRSQIHKVAALHSSVLLEGETGTGKGVAARMIHTLSGRSERPFIHVDCAALPPGLIETELFGHERGAFTGALNRRTGRFELAKSGTIFLDEIGDMDRSLQSRLMRVLEDRVFERVGGIETVPMQARVIAATSRDLASAVRQGDFREDLYFRLSILRLRLPPLRERIEDLPVLIRMGMRRIARRYATSAPVIPNALLAQLERHPWRGNVRELMNTLERTLVLPPEEVIDRDFLDGSGAGGAEQRFDALPRLRDPESEAMREEIRTVLAETGGNVARAARRLGISRSTLRYRILRHGLSHLIPMD